MDIGHGCRANTTYYTIDAYCNSQLQQCHSHKTGIVWLCQTDWDCVTLLTSLHTHVYLNLTVRNYSTVSAPNAVCCSLDLGLEPSMKCGTCDRGGGALGGYIMELDVDMSICPSIWNMRMSWSLWSFSPLHWLSTSNFILFSYMLLWEKAFVMLSIAAFTYVLWPFFCCCSEGPYCSGPAMALALSCNSCVDVVLLLGVDPCSWPLVLALLSKATLES